MTIPPDLSLEDSLDYLHGSPHFLVVLRELENWREAAFNECDAAEGDFAARRAVGRVSMISEVLDKLRPT